MTSNIPDSAQHMIDLNQKLYYKLSILGVFENDAFPSVNDAKSIIDAWTKEAESCGYDDLFTYRTNAGADGTCKISAFCFNRLVMNNTVHLVLPCFALLRNQPMFYKLGIQSKELTLYLHNLNWTELNAMFRQCQCGTLRIITDTTKVTNFNSLITNCVIKELDLTSFSSKTTIELETMFRGFNRIDTLRLSTDFKYYYYSVGQHLFERIVTIDNGG